MRTHLVYVAPLHRQGIEFNFGDGRTAQNVYTTGRPEWDHDGELDSWDEATIWEVEEAGIPVVIDTLSRKFPGREIKVFNLVSVFSRAIGDLKEKRVTSEGILPK